MDEAARPYELVPATKSVESLKGLVGTPAKPMSVEDMTTAIAARSGCVMIGLNTNVPVRYIAQDDAAQSPKASALIQSLTTDEPGYVTQIC